MAEESFIILDTTPSLMEPYSFLEMPESISLQSSLASGIARGHNKNPESVVGETADTANSMPFQNMAAMKSLWSTQPLVPKVDTNREEAEAAKKDDNPDSTPHETVSGAASTNEGNTVNNTNDIVYDACTPFASVSGISDAVSLKSTATTSSTEQTKKTIMSTTPRDTLAESFLMGNIDFETMKSSVNSHFPSLMTNFSAATEMEYSRIERDGIQDSIDVEALKEAPIREVIKCQYEIEELNKQNVGLQEKIVELQRLVEDQHIAQMAETDQTDSPAENDLNPAAEAIIAELKSNYEQQIQTLQFELSKAIGENMEIEDFKKSYVDEMDFLKVNLVATEELYKESVAQENILKSRNAYLSQEINDNKKLISKMDNDMALMKAQLEAFKKEFEIEKTSRQDIASEREQMLSDLQMLQRRNRELLDVAENGVSETPNQPATEVISLESFGEARAVPEYSCPLCMTVYRNYETLERHVDRCLDRSEQFD